MSERDKDVSTRKVFLLHNVISPERLPIFEALSRKVNLDVYFCMIQSKYRRSKAEVLKKYSFESNILTSIGLNLGDKHPLVISYNLLFRLLFKPYDYYIVCENPPIGVSILIVFFMSKLFDRPFILWSGFIESDYKGIWQRNPIKRLLVNTYRKLLYRYSNSFVAYGEMAKDYLIKQGVSKQCIFAGTQVISQELTNSACLFKRDANLIGKKIVLFVGYLVKRKGIDYLIRAFKDLKRDDSVLIIAGAGEEENKLKSLAEGKKNIIFPGFVQGEKKAKYYSLADIFVLPTLGDPWGLVMNEAMSFGLPTIVTERAGCPELVKDNAIIVPARNVEALKEAMQRLLDNDSLRRTMGRKSKEYIKKYNVDYAVNAFVNAIKYVSSRKTLQ